jgi:hypothetical protein
MTLPEIIDIFKSLPSGGMVTSDSRFRDGEIISLINTCKNVAQAAVFLKTKFAAPQWYVPFYPEHEEKWSYGCYQKFRMVDYVILDGIIGGLGYIGAERSNNTFIPLTSRVQLTDYMKHPILKPRKNESYILIENGFAEVYGQPVNNFRMGIIPSNPLDIPTFSYESDDYPIDIGLLDIMKKIAMNPDLNIMSKTPFDKVQDGMDGTAVNSTR